MLNWFYVGELKTLKLTEAGNFNFSNFLQQQTTPVHWKSKFGASEMVKMAVFGYSDLRVLVNDANHSKL